MMGGVAAATLRVPAATADAPMRNAPEVKGPSSGPEGSELTDTPPGAGLVQSADRVFELQSEALPLCALDDAGFGPSLDDLWQLAQQDEANLYWIVLSLAVAAAVAEAIHRGSHHPVEPATDPAGHLFA
jgi:hypothetical protein